MRFGRFAHRDKHLLTAGGRVWYNFGAPNRLALLGASCQLKKSIDSPVDLGGANVL
jgi:hypothetical protein